MMMVISIWMVIYIYILFFFLQVLDRMILYLRIVHSLDYYSASEYPNEDEMPHRCGIIHGRGPPPLKITQNDGMFLSFSRLIVVKLVKYKILSLVFIDHKFKPVLGIFSVFLHCVISFGCQEQVSYNIELLPAIE